MDNRYKWKLDTPEYEQQSLICLNCADSKLNNFYTVYEQYNYCPNCGSDMRLEDSMAFKIRESRAYQCKTEALANEFIKLFQIKVGQISHIYGGANERNNNWKVFQDGTCYRVVENKLFFHSAEWCKAYNMPIIEFRGK